MPHECRLKHHLPQTQAHSKLRNFPKAPKGILLNSEEKEGGRGGKLGIQVTSVKAVDGTKVSLRGVKNKSGKGGAGAGTYVVSFVCLGLIGVGLELDGLQHSAEANMRKSRLAR